MGITIEVQVSKENLMDAISSLSEVEALDLIQAIEETFGSSDFLADIFHWAWDEMFDEGLLPDGGCVCDLCKEK